MTASAPAERATDTVPPLALFHAARGSLLLFATRITARTGSVAYLAVLANFLPAAEVGYYAYHLALALMLCTFIEFGQATLVTRNQSANDPSSADGLSGAFRVVRRTSFAALLLGLLFAFGWPGLRADVLLLWAAMAFDAFASLTLTSARLEKRVGVIARAELIRYWVPCVVFVTSAEAFGVERALPFASVCAASGVAWAYVALVERRRLRPAFPLQPPAVRPLFRDGAPLFVLALAAGLNNRLDVVLLRHLDGAASVAKYAAAYAFVNGLMILPYVFSYLALPDFARLARTTADIQQSTLRQLTRGAAVVGLFAGLPLVVASRGLLRVFYGEAYLDGAIVLYYLAMALPFMFVSNLFWNILIAQKRQRYVFRYMLLATCVNIALNALLIPRYSVAGAALATLSVEIFICCAAAWSVRSVPLPIPLGRVGVALPFCAVLPTAAFVFSSRGLGWPAAAAVATAVLLLCCTVTGLIEARDFRQVARVVRAR